MINVTAMYIDGAKIGEGSRKCIADTETPVFSWAVRSDRDGDCQKKFRVVVFDKNKTYWNSGIIEKSEQSIMYGGEKLPHGTRIDIGITVCGLSGEESPAYTTSFVVGVLDDDEIAGEWITAAEPNDGRVLYFRRDFEVDGAVESACMYCSGFGYQKITINGIDIDDALLDPAHSNYEHIAYYTVHPDAASLISGAHNVIGIKVADGWRNNKNDFLTMMLGERKVEFFGEPALWAMLRIRYTDGRTEVIATDSSWQYKYGAVTMASIFMGETYDAGKSDNSWNTGAMTGFTPAKVSENPPRGERRAMALEPIRVQAEYPAEEIIRHGSDAFIVDFGQNIAGVVRMVLPEGMTAGTKIVMRHAEELNEDGTLFTEPLRGAACTDTYIASGDTRDLFVWQPEFTYHGFRYAEITGVCDLDKRDVTAVMFCTDIKNGSFFSCGSAIANKIQENLVMTEMDNMHSILTDCPQRDERMGWMNDATVRFEETPYNFDIGRIFPKIVRDIRAEQRAEGEFTCCCPFVFGGLPADPVCSSYLVAGMQSYLHTGNLEILREAFDGFAAWENFLLSRSDDYIVNYSYYGDWAAPAYACLGEDGANNSETEGILMSTGYSYFNCKTLAKMARALGRTEDAFKYIDLAFKVGGAFLKKWWHPETATVGSGSEASQAFALWLGLVPKEYEQKAADVMCRDLRARNYKFTTGNLCTRYMFDMLAKFGYIDDAWKLMTNETYPSFGYMIQNEATTIWERFELKKNPGMNSHNHPMYGAVGYFFYAYIAGIVPTEAGYKKVRIKPYFPESLQFAHAVVDTVKGDISVRWSKRYGKLYLFVDIPFGVTADVDFGGKVETVGSGYHVFETKYNVSL